MRYSINVCLCICVSYSLQMKTDIPYDIHTEGSTLRKLMKIRLQKRYKPYKFTFECLKSEYVIFAVREARSVMNSLSAALKGK